MPPRAGAYGGQSRRTPQSGQPDQVNDGYVVDRAIDQKKITRDDMVTVGKDAWAAGNPVFKGSSLMFLKPGDKLSVRDLSRGVIIDSGNDACVALADYVAGSQDNFVKLMNHYVEKLGLTNTHFETVHGWMRQDSSPVRWTWQSCLAPSSTASRISMPCTVRKP